MPAFSRVSMGGARSKKKSKVKTDNGSYERLNKVYELRKQFDESLGTIEIQGKEYPAAFVLWHVDFGDTNLRFVNFLQQNGIDLGPF
jgi:hypothetical protein